MGRQSNKKRNDLLWPRMMMKKWLNTRSTGDEFSADELDDTDPDTESESDCEYANIKPSPRQHTTRKYSSPLVHRKDASVIHPPEFFFGKTFLRRSNITTNPQPEMLSSRCINKDELRIMVGTWNVAGKPPSPQLDLKEWLDTNDPADMYVIGFQEIVPLNAGNVFGAEDSEPAVKWRALIRETLNRPMKMNCKSWSSPPSPSRDIDMDTERILIDEETSFIPTHPPSIQSKEQSEQDINNGKTDILGVYRRTESIGLKRSHHERNNSEPIDWLSACDIFSDTKSPDDDNAILGSLSPLVSRSTYHDFVRKRLRYVCVASKQMVGLHISVWVRKKLRRHIHNLTVSCVGLGIMGCLGNKGSISVSMLFNDTTFCFICTHLTSGDKDGDELRRNADVTEILRRTYFPSTNRRHNKLPKTIWQHDQIIWLGDLNYRVNLPDNDIRFLVAREDWTALLEKDQLRNEMFNGHTFDGWHEGHIYFAPTYKYEINSSQYIGKNAKPGEKLRAPAWCDRILWRGERLQQVYYRRAELMLSDHRPVKAMFLAQADVSRKQSVRKIIPFKSMKVEIEELLMKS